jgi:CRISPR/Cas system endoribonuclease Cas6 (RAMP superfamily)
MKKLIIVLSFFSLFQLSVKGQETVKTPAEKQADYTKMISQRSDKIVDKLNITEAKKAKLVSGMIAAHYSNLNDIYSRRDDAKKNLKVMAAPNKPSEEAIKNIEGKASFSVDSLHPIFLKQLATQLNEKQVIQVKDGLTYSVLPLTYNAYLDELPELKENQKAQMMVWLIEAREQAMDAESSEKKHAWFGKFKGRINNYLSKEGYDMKKAGEEWQKRIKARKS